MDKNQKANKPNANVKPEPTKVEDVKTETSNPQSEPAKGDETAKSETVVEIPKTLEQLREIATLAASVLSEVIKKGDDLETSKALVAMAKAQKEINEFKARELAKEQQAIIDVKKQERYFLVDNLLELAEKARIASEDYRTGKSTLEDANMSNDRLRAATNFVKEELAKTVVAVLKIKPTLIIPQGMTGAQLKKEGGGISQEIRDLLEQGKNIDEIEALGYLRKTISDVRWGWEKSKGMR